MRLRAFLVLVTLGFAASQAAATPELHCYGTSDPQGLAPASPAEVAMAAEVSASGLDDEESVRPAMAMLPRVRRDPTRIFAVGAGPLFATPRWIEQQSRRSVDPRDPYYVPQFSR